MLRPLADSGSSTQDFVQDTEVQWEQWGARVLIDSDDWFWLFHMIDPDWLWWLIIDWLLIDYWLIMTDYDWLWLIMTDSMTDYWLIMTDSGLPWGDIPRGKSLNPKP